MNKLWDGPTLVIVLLLGFVFGFAWGDGAGFRVGERHAEARAEAAKSYHDTVMRKIGVCSWAKIMAAQIECKNEFKPGEP